MIIVGLTGSIGMGKSTAAQMLRDMGVPVHDSDATVHALMAPHGYAIPMLARAFPTTYNSTDQTIDRAALGQIVFHDDAQRKILEGILHPLVWESQQEFLREHRQKHSPVVVLDIPLLFETKAHERVDKVIVVSAPAFIQHHRVMARPGMTESRFHGILNSQMPDHEKRKRADFVVQTGFGRALTVHSLKKIMEGLGHGKTRHSVPSHDR